MRIEGLQTTYARLYRKILGVLNNQKITAS